MISQIYYYTLLFNLKNQSYNRDQSVEIFIYVNIQANFNKKSFINIIINKKILFIIIQKCGCQIIVENQNLNNQSNNPNEMLKNKTHRIISISPNNKNQCQAGLTVKSGKNVQNGHNGHNKTTTPIKPFQLPTRTNTIKTQKIEGEPAEDTCRKNITVKNQNMNFLESVFVSSYKDELHPHAVNQKMDPLSRRDNLDQILHRIGKKYQNQNNNPSNQLLKKSKIAQLRQSIRDARILLNSKSQPHDNPLRLQASEQIERLTSTIKSQIFSYFTSLHQELYRKQKAMHDELEQRIFQLKQKNITKYYQQISLKAYIDKCQADIDNNYDGIIKELGVKELTRIVQSYFKKIQFYADKIKEHYSIKFNCPQTPSRLENFEASIGIQLVKDGDIGVNTISVFSGNHEETKTKTARISVPTDKKPFQQINLSVEKKQTIGNTKPNTNSKAIGKQQSQGNKMDLNLSLNKILAKKLKSCREWEPRISSARGRY